MTEGPDGGDALARLEQRVATLEALVRRLVAAGPSPANAATVAPPPPPTRPEPTRAEAAPQFDPQEWLAARQKLRRTASPKVDWEQWVGSRGLLAVGVAALLIAAAFLLKYAFDRGWVAPWLRVLGGIAAGIAVGLYGERRVAAGMRRFGLALIGAGGGLVYLAIWAAAGPYVMISRQAGTLLIALVTAVVAWRALHHDAEPLALWALAGAFAAPLLLPAPDARPELLLAYTAIVAYAAGVLAMHSHWRRAIALAAVGYFLLTPAIVPDVMHTAPGFVYLALGGMLALRALQSRPWPESRFGTQLAAWGLLIIMTGGAHGPARWVAVLSAAALLGTTWWDALMDGRYHDSAPKQVDAWGAMFFAVPAAFCTVTAIARPGVLATSPELATMAAAALYLLAGWHSRWILFVGAGLALVAVACAQQWSGSMLIGEWSALVLLAVVIDTHGDQQAGAPIALLLGSLTLSLLLSGLARDRWDAAFTGGWSRALYVYCILLGVAAVEWKPREGAAPWHRRGNAVLWTLAGLALLAGVSILLRRAFADRAAHGGGSGIAGDLAISIWWLLYAAALVRIGFWRKLALVRSAGLAVAGLAALKVMLFDLSRLDALYRVASFFGLALIALAVAYAYNKRVHQEPANLPPA